MDIRNKHDEMVHGPCDSPCCWRLGEWDRATLLFACMQVVAGDDVVGWVFLIDDDGHCHVMIA
jgi:hypothetical protein